MSLLVKVYEKNIQLIHQIELVVLSCRKQNIDFIQRTLSNIILHLEKLFKDIIIYQQENNNISIIEQEYFIAMLSGILNAQEEQDHILLGDLLELQLVPLLYQIQDTIRSLEDITCKAEILEENLKILNKRQNLLIKLIREYKEEPNYTLLIEDTTTGDYTLKIHEDEKQYYFHSNKDPVEEARILIEDYIEQDKEHYIVYGLGLGYHVQELCKKEKYKKITIIESDLNIIIQTLTFRDLREVIDQENVELIYDENLTILADLLQNSNRVKVIIHYPSMRHTKNQLIKNSLEQFFVKESSMRNRKSDLNENFRGNKVYFNNSVDELQDIFTGKTIIIVAAGPSLDKNVDLLRKKPEGTIILSTGTVFSKLIKLGIRPDYCIVSESDPLVNAQFEEVWSECIPLLILSTANHDIFVKYKGDKYVIFQSGYEAAECMAEKKGYRLHQTGGSVSTVALDVAIRMKCSRIIFIGLDLAFTNSLSHAANTHLLSQITHTNNFVVKSNTGEILQTSQNLIIYKKWIENRIKELDCKLIKIIDATEGGALIEGLVIDTLANVLLE